MTSTDLVLLPELESVGSAAEICARTLAHHSKSFALAGRLLPAQQRTDAAVLYTYCRLVDDRIDLVAQEAQPAALEELRHGLDSVYRGEPQDDVRLRAFQELVIRQSLPREYPEQLLLGMAMDAERAEYHSLAELLLYCHRVAGVVGLMMCHVLGVSEARALKHAAHLGIAMQLTNICRDIAEDWQRGRLYLPRDWVRESGAVLGPAGGELPREARGAIATVSARLLREADRFYRSGDAGLWFLPWRAAFSIRAARLIYSAIGGRVQQSGYDVSTRAVVPPSSKLMLLVKAALCSLSELPRRWLSPHAAVQLGCVMRYPDDILPV